MSSPEFAPMLEDLARNVSRTVNKLAARLKVPSKSRVAYVVDPATGELRYALRVDFAHLSPEGVMTWARIMQRALETPEERVAREVREEVHQILARGVS